MTEQADPMKRFREMASLCELPAAPMAMPEQQLERVASPVRGWRRFLPLAWPA